MMIKARAYSNPRINRVIIQMGMDKTATTSIQLFLSQNRQWLHQNSLEYRTDWGADNHSIPIMSLVSANPEEIYWHIVSGHGTEEIQTYNDKNFSALCKGVRDCQQETYIFFGEGICGLSIDELYRLKEMIEALMPQANVGLLYCVRSVSGYASSGYQQAIKMGRFYTDSRLVFIYSNIYFRRMIRAMAIFGKNRMTVYRFEDALRHEYGPVGYFIEKLDVSLDGMEQLQIPVANESISHQATELIEFINRSHPMILDNKKNDKREKYDTMPIMRIKGSKYKLPAKIASLINRASLLDLLWLRFAFRVQYPIIWKVNSTAEFKYDETYSQQFMEAFESCNDLLKSCLYDFAIKKTMSTTNEMDKKVFLELQKKISDNYYSNYREGK